VVTLHLKIQGRVQGVWFRESMRREAQRLGVNGWVCNRPDGSVEATIQGSADAVKALNEWAHSGPPLAHVQHVARTSVVTQERFSTFEKRAV
jgi:acylphosphatase